MSVFHCRTTLPPLDDSQFRPQVHIPPAFRVDLEVDGPREISKTCWL